MNSAKRLIILTPGFPANEEDANCIPILQVFVKAMNRLKPELSLQVIAFQYPFISKSYTWHGIPVHALGGANRKGIYRLMVWFKAWRTLSKLRKKDQSLLLHSIWLTECYALSSLYAAFHKVSLVATVLGQDARRENAYLRWFRDKRCQVVCSSAFAAKVLKEEQGMDCRAVIPIGIDRSEFSETNSVEPLIDIIGVGNLGPVKRFDVFIRVIAGIKARHPQIKAEIIGEGELRGSLEDLIRELGLQDNLCLRGELSRPLVLQAMRRSRILLHCASYEGQCYVYLEALASGASVVALNRGYLPRSEKVKVVEEDHELASACLDLLSKEEPSGSFIPLDVEESVEQYYSIYQD